MQTDNGNNTDIDDDLIEYNEHPDGDNDFQDEVFRSFIVKFVTMIAVTVILVVSHARELSLTMQVILPVVVGCLLMGIFRYLGFWRWK